MSRHIEVGLSDDRVQAAEAAANCADRTAERQKVVGIALLKAIAVWILAKLAERLIFRD